MNPDDTTANPNPLPSSSLDPVLSNSTSSPQDFNASPATDFNPVPVPPTPPSFTDIPQPTASSFIPQPPPATDFNATSPASINPWETVPSSAAPIASTPSSFDSMGLGSNPQPSFTPPGDLTGQNLNMPMDPQAYTSSPAPEASFNQDALPSSQPMPAWDPSASTSPFPSPAEPTVLPTPPAESPINPMPTFVPPTPVGSETPTQPSAYSSPDMNAGQAGYWSSSVESAPTDLSQLVGNNMTPSLSVPQTSVTPPESLGISQPVTPEVTQVVTSPTGKGSSKLALIIGGLVLLLLVSGASAYFILGIGQDTPLPKTETTSLPAIEQALEQTLTNPPQPTSTAQVPLSNESALMPEVISSTPPAATPSGTSAIERLKQR